MLATASCAFMSCNKPDPDPEPAPTPIEVETHALVGVWKCTDSNGDTAVLTLNSDHTGTLSISVESRVTVVATATEYFNWNTSDDSSANHWFEIIHTGGDYVFEYVNMTYILAGNTLRLDGLVYTRIK